MQSLLFNSFKIVFITLFIVSCQETWNFEIVNLDDPTHPHFCFSRYKNCEGEGFSTGTIDIWEVDRDTAYIQEVWSITQIEKCEIKNVIYGIAPNGYKETMSALPLEIGKYYAVKGNYYFRLIKKGEKVIPEIWQLESMPSPLPE